MKFCKKPPLPFLFWSIRFDTTINKKDVLYIVRWDETEGNYLSSIQSQKKINENSVRDTKTSKNSP